MNDDQLIEAYFKLVEPMAGALDFDEDDEAVFIKSYNALPIPDRHLAVCNYCLGNVLNGGFGQFFMNESGVAAPEVVEGFRQTNEPGLAAVVQQAIAFFKTGFPRSITYRERLLQGDQPDDENYLPKSTLDYFRPLEDQFYQIIGKNGDEYLKRMANIYAKRF